MTPRLKTKRRELSAAEWALFPESFKAVIEPAKVRLINRAHNPFARGKILVRGNRIYWPDYPEDFTVARVSEQALLMHELTHVWQYATGRLNAFKYLIMPKNWIYHYNLDDVGRFEDLPIEKQADMMQDWYRVNCACAPVRYATEGGCPAPEVLNMIVPFTWDLEAAA